MAIEYHGMKYKPGKMGQWKAYYSKIIYCRGIQRSLHAKEFKWSKIFQLKLLNQLAGIMQDCFHQQYFTIRKLQIPFNLQQKSAPPQHLSPHHRFPGKPPNRLFNLTTTDVPTCPLGSCKMMV